jgi:hypothetical protein
MRFTKKTYSLVVGAAVLFLGLLGVLSQSDSCSLFGKITGSYACKPSVILPDGYVYVVNVVDGDTFDVSIDGKTQRVRVLNRGERVDEQVPGSGLGLAIVKHAMQRHGGRLAIESLEGRGSTFTCHFPPDRLIRHEASGSN